MLIPLSKWVAKMRHENICDVVENPRVLSTLKDVEDIDPSKLKRYQFSVPVIEYRSMTIRAKSLAAAVAQCTKKCKKWQRKVHGEIKITGVQIADNTDCYAAHWRTDFYIGQAKQHPTLYKLLNVGSFEEAVVPNEIPVPVDYITTITANVKEIKL